MISRVFWKFLVLCVVSLVILQLWHVPATNSTITLPSFVEDTITLPSFVEDTEYNSECGFPWLPSSTMDVKPSEKVSELWKMRTHLSSTEIDQSKLIPNPLFYPGLSHRQRQTQARLLGVLHDFLTRHSIMAVVHGGVVLGAIRHHGFVPWDSDVDFMMHPNQKILFDTAVRNESTYLATEGVGVYKRPGRCGGGYLWTSSQSIPTTELKRNCTEVPVPMIEIAFVDPERPKYKCSSPLTLRLIYTEGEVPFWTCLDQIETYSSEHSFITCNAAWNHPTLDDRLCGKQLFPNRSFIPTKDEIRDRWKLLIGRSELNPEGMWGKCETMRAVYNFADRLETDSNSTSLSQYTEQLIRKRNWTCYQGFVKLEWTPSQLQLSVRGESISVLKRNHSEVSVRHRVVLESTQPTTTTDAAPPPILCELHVTTRKTEDDIVWAKVMGFHCNSSHQWCNAEGDRRQWTRLSELGTLVGR